MRIIVSTIIMTAAVSFPALAATKDADYKALFAKAQQAYLSTSADIELAKAQVKELPAHKKRLLAVKTAIGKADAIVKDDLTRITALRKHLKALPGLVKKGEAAIKKDIADVKLSSGIQIRKAMFRMTLDFRGDQGRDGALWLEANIFGVDKEIKTRWNFDDVKPQMEKLGRLLGAMALAEANYKANQLGIDVAEVKAAATGAGSVVQARWSTTQTLIDEDAATGLRKLKIQVEHAGKN